VLYGVVWCCVVLRRHTLVTPVVWRCVVTPSACDGRNVLGSSAWGVGLRPESILWAGRRWQEIAVFFAGVSISAVEYKVQIESFVEPIKEFGVVLFFFILGMTLPLQPETILAALIPGVIVAALTVPWPSHACAGGCVFLCTWGRK
jgi:hypothetical protein